MVEVYSTRLRAPGAGPVTETRAADIQGPINAAAGALSQAAEMLRRADQARQLTDARRSMLEGYAAADADLEKDQDWLDMEARQDQRLVKIREEALGRIGYESLREEFALDMDRAGFQHMDKVRGRAFGLQKNHTLTALDETLTLYRERAAKIDDPLAINGFLDDAAAAVDDVRAGGFIDELEARRLTEGLENGVFGDFTARLVERDPEHAARMLANPGGLPVDEQTRLTALGRAKGEIERRRVQAENQILRDEARAERALAEWKEASLIGLPLTPERQAALMAEIAPAGESYVRRAQAAERRTGLYQRFALTPPAERAAALDRWRRGGGATADDVDLFGKLQHLDQGLTDAEERIRAAALREAEQERKELEREERAEQRRLASEKDKFLQEMLGDQAASEAAGLPYAYGPQLAAAVQGTKFEGEYNRNVAIGDLWREFRAASPEGKAAIAAQLRALPAPDKRHVQFIGELERDAEQALKELGSDLTARFNENLSAFGKGFELESFAADLAEIRARDPDLGLALNRAYTDFLNLKNAAGATPWELAPKTLEGGMPLPRDAREAATYAEYERMQGQAAKQWTDDRMAGPWAHPAPPVDFADPGSVQERILYAQAITRKGPVGSEVVYTSKAERATLKAMLDDPSGPDAAALWLNIATAAGAAAPVLLAELDAPPSIRWAVGMPTPQRGEMLRRVGLGVSRLDSGLVRKPSPADQAAWTEEVVGPLFSRSSQILGQIMETGTALYAAEAKGGDDPATSKDAWVKGLQAALGSDGEKGGVRSFRRRKTIMPPGMSAEQVEAALRGLHGRFGWAYYGLEWGQASFGGHTTVRKPTERPPMSSAWGGITSNGQPPLIGGQPITPEILSNVTLLAVEGGYLMEWRQGDAFFRLDDPAPDPTTGLPRPLIINLPELARRS